MFARTQIDSKLNAEILSALAKLEESRDDPQKYEAALDRVAKLEKLKPDSRFKPLGLDTVLIVGANIFGILWLARYERENAEVIRAPSAMRFVMKP